MEKNYKLFPANLMDFKYDEDIEWLVVTSRDWDANIIAGKCFSAFSVAAAYCIKNPFIDFVITIVQKGF